MNLGLLCSAMLVLFTGPAAAQVTTFDVFGVRVGDGPEAVTRALTEKGFSKDVELRGPTFDEQVALRRNKIDLGSAKGAVKEITYRRDSNKISIMFTAWPDGEKVTRVFYRPNITQADCPAFTTAAQQKYGVGIEYAGEWIDRPVEKTNGFSERKLDETVSIAAKCSAGSRYLAMDLFGAQKMQNQMLDKADGEVKHDF
ncbi:hypothetical protein [Agrobacterium tumefaciens]|uniref:hypothetical protein n=1 Tax=Agrobacterium tumefaciens TaxID=358 RepID=UPI00384BF979